VARCPSSPGCCDHPQLQGMARVWSGQAPAGYLSGGGVTRLTSMTSSPRWLIRCISPANAPRSGRSARSVVLPGPIVISQSSNSAHSGVPACPRKVISYVFDCTGADPAVSYGLTCAPPCRTVTSSSSPTRCRAFRFPVWCLAILALSAWEVCGTVASPPADWLTCGSVDTFSVRDRDCPRWLLRSGTTAGTP
jgi:hypothetical protein